MPPSPGATACAERLAERLERRLGDVVIVGAGRLDVHRAAGLHGESLERVGEERQREPPDALAGERERDLGVRAPDEVDGSEGARLVHRDDRGAVPREALRDPSAC